MVKHLKGYLPGILLLSFSVLSTQTKAQTQAYDAYINGHKVGEMTVVREISDERTKIFVKTHIETHLSVKTAIDFSSQSTYMNNKLIVGESELKIDGNLKSLVIIVLKDDYYEVNKDGSRSDIPGSDLVANDFYYFEVPNHGEQAYDLATGEISDIIEKGKSTFRFGRHDEIRSYLFNKRVPEKLEVKHGIHTIIFKLKA